jgi:hypothetical protein
MKKRLTPSIQATELQQLRNEIRVLCEEVMRARRAIGRSATRGCAGYTITQFARMHGYKSRSGIYAAIERGDIPTYRPYPGADRHIPAWWVHQQIIPTAELEQTFR